MSEIEKLMQNAGFKRFHTKEYTFDPTEAFKNNEHFVCYDYPPFTAEKQLELIKWLAKRRDFALDYYPSCNIWVAKTEFCWEYYEKTYEHKETEQALAGLINNLWQDLSDTEKAEIKEILK